MKRALMFTLGALVVLAAAVSLARDAKSLSSAESRALLLCLCVFVVFEWASHYLGSRFRWTLRARPERAAWAALSSAGIWVALLSTVPALLGAAGLDPAGPAGLLVMAVASGGALALRLWFLREIYEVDIERATGLWAATRGAAMLLLCSTAAVCVVAAALEGSAGPPLRIGP